MSGKRTHNSHEGLKDGLPPYWRRAHRDWRFWMGLSLMLLAITVYILSDNLTFLEHS